MLRECFLLITSIGFSLVKLFYFTFNISLNLKKNSIKLENHTQKNLSTNKIVQQKISYSPSVKERRKKKHMVEEINADCHIIASFAAGVATGSRRIKSKDVLDRVS